MDFNRENKMKYYKLEYDMNRPSTKSLPVPTNSDYGVAVKVFRNGELVNGDLSVGGLSATTKGDWKLVDLSSGSTEGIGELDVRMEKGASVQTTLTGTATKTSSIPMPITVYLTLATIGDTALHGITSLPASWMKRFDVEYLLSSSTGIGEPTEAPTEKKNFLVNQTNYWLENGKWKTPSTETDTLSIDDDTTIQITNIALNNQTLSAYYDIEIDSGDGVTDNFKILVSTQDKGYIEAE